MTVDKDFSIAQAVAVGSGKILKVGENNEVRDLASSNTTEIDLNGKMVVPGFIDTHPHVTSLAVRGATLLPLADLSSVEAIKKRIAQKIESTPQCNWVVTSPIGEPPYYFNVPDILKEKRWPTRWDLDEISPNNPVYITPPLSKAPNTAIINSFGLKLLGITRDTPSEIQGVEIIKDTETGEPNGQLHGMQPIYNSSPLFEKLSMLLPSPSSDDIVNKLRDLIKERNSAGITTIYEGHYVTSKHLRPCVEMWAKNELTVRVCFAYELDLTKELNELENYLNDLVYAAGSGFGDDRLKICGITVSPDGPIRIGLGAMNKPYPDLKGNLTTGVMYVPTPKFKQIALLAAKNNLRFNSCVGGDRAADITLEVFEEVNKKVPISDKRWVIQHIRFSSQNNINKCKELGVYVTICTNFEWGEGTEVYANKLGNEFAAKAMPLRRWLDSCVCVALSTDFGPFHPMFTLWQSLKRVHGQTGKSFAGKDQRITREEAIRMYTINGAKVLFWEDNLGSIEVGKLADLVILDNDILTCPLDEIKETRVLMTMMGGEIVYQEA